VHLKLQSAAGNGTTVTGEACSTEAQRTVDLAFEKPMTRGMDVKMMSRARAKVFMLASSEARAKAEKMDGLSDSAQGL